MEGKRGGDFRFLYLRRQALDQTEHYQTEHYQRKLNMLKIYPHTYVLVICMHKSGVSSAFLTVHINIIIQLLALRAVPLPSGIYKGSRACRIKTLIAILPCRSVLSYVHALISSAGAGVRESAIAIGLARLPPQCRVSPAAMAPCLLGGEVLCPGAFLLSCRDFLRRRNILLPQFIKDPKLRQPATINKGPRHPWSLFIIAEALDYIALTTHISVQRKGKRLAPY